MNEIEENIKNNFEAVYKTTTIIALIQIFASLILIIFGWFYSAYRDNSVNQKAIPILWFLVISFVILSFILRRVLFSRKRLLESSRQIGVLSDLQNTTAILIFLGLIITLFGFLIGSLSGNKLEILRAGLAALVVFIFNFPRKTIWQKIVYQSEKV